MGRESLLPVSFHGRKYDNSELRYGSGMKSVPEKLRIMSRDLIYVEDSIMIYLAGFGR